MSYRWLLGAVLLTSLSAWAAPVYRYQDEQGRWHFTDRKPPVEHEQVTFSRTARSSPPVPSLQAYEQEAGDERLMVAHNPWHAPVEFCIHSGKTLVLCTVAEPLSEAPVMHNGQPFPWQDNYRYRYVPGRPNARHDRQPLQPPLPPGRRFRITQAFEGAFSHDTDSSRHAVDIAMSIGEYIHAARDGVVVLVKDDYHLGGLDPFFLDKANYILIVHSDDTLGIYAHTLMGSARVQPGDTVTAGTPLARAGTSGYSSGPHLHFVLQVNRGKGLVSVPFRFSVADGSVVPKQGEWLQVQR